MKTAIMFSGQGTQYPGMMRDILESYPQAKNIFDLAGKVLGQDIYGMSMNSSQEELNRTRNTQPCLLALPLCWSSAFPAQLCACPGLIRILCQLQWGQFCSRLRFDCAFRWFS